MTVKLGDGGGGEEGLKRLGKRAADEDALEGEGAGSGDAAEDSGGTKRDGKTPRGGGGGPPAPAGGPQAQSPPPACPQDQHHFLRSSVRPQSKRLRKDSSCAGGSSSAGSSGPRGKGTGDPSHFQGRTVLASWPPPHFSILLTHRSSTHLGWHSGGNVPLSPPKRLSLYINYAKRQT